VTNFENFNLHLSETCSKFNFTIKIPTPDSGLTQKLIFMGKSPHNNSRDGFDRLSGFATENQLVISNFKEGLESIKNRVIDELEDPRNLVSFLEGLIEK
jgi:hypothetical protein